MRFGKERSKGARLVLLLVGALALAAIASGCGGGDGNDSNNSTSSKASNELKTSPLSKDEYLKRALAACVKERDDILADYGAYLKKHRKEGVPEPVLIANMVKAVLLPTIEAEIADLRALGAPKGDEGEIAAILAEEQAIVDELRKATKRVGGFEEVEGHFVDVTRKLHEYGFEGCTNSP